MSNHITLPSSGPVGADALGLIEERIAGDPARLDEHVVLFGVAEPGAEDVGVGGPEFLAGFEVEGHEARVGGLRFVRLQLGELLAGEAVDGVEPAAADAGGVVAEAARGGGGP